jgi:hypothetical protein
MGRFIAQGIEATLLNSNPFGKVVHLTVTFALHFDFDKF